MIVLFQTLWSGSDRSYCRTSPGSSGVQLECLMKPKLIGCIHFFALREKKKKTLPPPAAELRAYKIKQSPCGFSLAQHKDRQNKWTYVDLQKRIWGNVSWRGSSQRTSCLWGQMLAACLPVTPVEHRLPISWQWPRLINLPLLQPAPPSWAAVRE